MNPEDKEYPINEETRSRYGVTAYPAVLFLSADGGLIHKASGFLPPDQFSPIMEDALAKEESFLKKLAELKESPDDATLNAEVAITYLNRMQLEKAEALSAKAFKLDPTNSTALIPQLHTQLGLAYGMLVESTMIEDPETAETYFEKSVSHFKAVIDTYPDSEPYEPAQYYLGVTYAIKGDFKAAIATLQSLANHATDENLKMQAEAMLQRVQELEDAH